MGWNKRDLATFSSVRNGSLFSRSMDTIRGVFSESLLENRSVYIYRAAIEPVLVRKNA